jgi:hypothetical protein
MKNTLIAFFSLLSLSVCAQTLETRSFSSLMKAIQSTTFTYKETGKLPGYETTKSCMHISDTMVIFKNYCSPAGNYPVKGYTIISREFGVVDLYEEDLETVLKRDILQTQFSVVLEGNLPATFPNSSLKDLNLMLKTMHDQYLPSCWSTNLSFYTEAPDTNCNIDVAKVQGYEAWKNETQTFLGSEVDWIALMKAIDQKLAQ